MDTRRLERFAQAARRQLHEEVAARLERVLRTDSAELRAKVKAIRALEAEIKASSSDAVVERVAYTWFNRFIALRYMDVNGITRMGTVSPAISADGVAFTQPELLQEAKQGIIDDEFARYVDAETVFGLLNGRLPSGDPQQEAYRLLLVGVCNATHEPMPFLFQRIDDYTELLMPDDLLSEGSILQAVRASLTVESCQNVEVIGWLYQYYISEKKAAVMARKGAVPSEDIPAVTQLFTPHWIVRYMVENSLGRLWMMNHPGSRIVERMDYYIAPDGGGEDSGQWPVVSGQGSGDLVTSHQPPATNHQPLATDHQPLTTSPYPLITSPEEIRLCDPACGSGHILTYAFDLLYAIYEEAGYDPVAIPRLILEKNLTGIEIDPRAGALAGFALMMKAREKDRRFLRRGVQPDICVLENVTFTPQELDDYIDAVGRDLFTQDVRDWLQQFEQATTFGSLIRPLVTDTASIRERLDKVGVLRNLFLNRTQARVDPVLRMTEALSPRYHVVVANPPYMGSKGMNAELKDFAKDAYPDSKSDLCTMFIERNLDLVMPKGVVGMITMMSWMFLSSFAKLRMRILDKETIETMAHLGARAFDTIGGEVVSTSAFTLKREAAPDYRGQYFRLIDGNSEAEKAQMLVDALPTNHQPLTTNHYSASAADFKKIPGAPIAYWVSNGIRWLFTESASLESKFERITKGIFTGDNKRFLRYWYEVSQDRGGWRRYNKAGGARKWYGLAGHVLDWRENGKTLSDYHGAGLGAMSYYGKPHICWSGLTSAAPTFRDDDDAVWFDDVAPAIVDDGVDKNILCFLNSRLTSVLLGILNPTMHYQIGDVKRLPSPDLSDARLAVIRKTCVQTARADWNAYETSWGFTVLALVASKGLLSGDPPLRMSSVYSALCAHWQSMTEETQHLEEESNRIFSQIYGLEDELNSKVALSEITLTCNPHHRYPDTSRRIVTDEEREALLLGDTMREFISYAVGCMFGRYSLDKPGLVLANQGETVEDYLRVVGGQTSGRAQGRRSVDSGQGGGGREEAEEGITFMPDEDNVIPMLDGDWFVDDVSERFKAFLRMTFGDAHYEENLAFIEAAIGRDIRSYFVRDFYKDHVKTYKKRPIYWLFSSPKGSFNALIYMHRYQPDTVSIVLNDYLREFRTKLSARKSHLEQVSISASAAQRERTQALKEIERIDKTLNELRAYEDEVLYPLATERVEIDLDDGVLVNYKKFGRALKKI